jgi:hypothetical protein
MEDCWEETGSQIFRGRRAVYVPLIVDVEDLL